jgi:hypothetical protein
VVTSTGTEPVPFAVPGSITVVVTMGISVVPVVSGFPGAPAAVTEPSTGAGATGTGATVVGTTGGTAGSFGAGACANPPFQPA